MAWWTLVQAGVQIAAGVAANQRARRTGRMNERLIKMETEEQVRRMDLSQRLRIGEYVAKTAASGILGDRGSAQRYKKALESEFNMQREYFLKTGRQRAELARRTGKHIGMGDIYGGILNAGASLLQPDTRRNPAGQQTTTT
jgi:hypothetical protein